MQISFSWNIAILGCYDVIQEEIKQISIAKNLKTCEDHEWRLKRSQKKL